MNSPTLEKTPVNLKLPAQPEHITYHTTMSRNGQILIPKPIREQLGLKPGDVFTIVPTQDNKIVLFKQRSLHENLSEWRATLSPKAKANISKMAGWTISQYHQHFDDLSENITQRKQRYGL